MRQKPAVPERLRLPEQMTFEWDPKEEETQRWNHRQQSWKRAREGGFRASEYEVEELFDDSTAKTFIETHHYTGAYVAAVKRYALYEHGLLVGVAVLSSPVNERTLTNAFPQLVPYVQALELGRFVLLDRVACNGETYFLSRVLKLAARDGIRGVVSFSDPVARQDRHGQSYFPGHLGRIYQIGNGIYTGRGTPRTLLLLPDGSVYNARTEQKVRSQEQGVDYSEKRLVDFGAAPRREDEDPQTWLRHALVEAGARRLRHPGNHRYLFVCGSPARKRAIHLGLTTQPYPKIFMPKDRPDARLIE
jgi:hypothetical protein